MKQTNKKNKTRVKTETYSALPLNTSTPSRGQRFSKFTLQVLMFYHILKKKKVWPTEAKVKYNKSQKRSKAKHKRPKNKEKCRSQSRERRHTRKHTHTKTSTDFKHSNWSTSSGAVFFFYLHWHKNIALINILIKIKSTNKTPWPEFFFAHRDKVRVRNRWINDRTKPPPDDVWL